MASRNCKFRSLVDCYGHFPLKNRFGGDQVPLELNRRDFTLDLQGTTDPVHIRGPKKDIDKRQATIQLFVRVEGWTREKVARAYNDAPLKGIPKSLFLEKWAEKYNFPLGQQKAATWVRKYINDEDSNIDSEESFIESD